MTYGGIKTYHLIILDFWKRKYVIFKYEKDRRLTSRQAWKMFYENEVEPIKEGVLAAGSTIIEYENIIAREGYDIKHCDLLMRFPPIV